MKERMRWGLVLLAGFLAELTVFAIVFPVLYMFGQQAFLASILIASAVMPGIFAVWIGKRITARFALHGALVGLTAALIYTAIAWGQPQPLLYKISHGFKILGGATGGAIASRRKIASRSPS